MRPNRTLIRISIWIFSVPKVTERPGPARPGPTTSKPHSKPWILSRFFCHFWETNFEIRLIVSISWKISHVKKHDVTMTCIGHFRSLFDNIRYYIMTSPCDEMGTRSFDDNMIARYNDIFHHRHHPSRGFPRNGDDYIFMKWWRGITMQSYNVIMI